MRREPAEIELTPRQMDVLRGLEAGKTASEIADDLVLGRETIRTTIKALYKRLGVHSKASALQVARSVGLI
ncbi:helix-turn-helix transcriptional regulator [Actinomyces radicidentis]|uniref:response regulator transcription factor n=1 Tax=Actinomyces radicidentis TaxID=111015 RepID=UPI0028E792BB|nr:helix-turn-helix transcriptional regulator [Actinomyces radicidentis]